MELSERNLSDIKPSAFNPASRTAAEALRSLLKSIKTHGVLQPLLISEKGEIIDGHRRFACAKALGLKSVPVIISNHDQAGTVAEKFETVNTHMKKLGPRDMIFVYCNGGAVPKHVEDKITQLEALIGADRLDEISTQDVSYRIVDNAQRVASYCSAGRDEKFKKKICNWLIDHHMSWRTSRAMEDGIPARVIKSAVERNKPLSHSWGVAVPKAKR